MNHFYWWWGENETKKATTIIKTNNFINLLWFNVDMGSAYTTMYTLFMKLYNLTLFNLSFYFVFLTPVKLNRVNELMNWRSDLSDLFINIISYFVHVYKLPFRNWMNCMPYSFWICSTGTKGWKTMCDGKR